MPVKYDRLHASPASQALRLRRLPSLPWPSWLPALPSLVSIAVYPILFWHLAPICFVGNRNKGRKHASSKKKQPRGLAASRPHEQPLETVDRDFLVLVVQDFHKRNDDLSFQVSFHGNCFPEEAFEVAFEAAFEATRRLPFWGCPHSMHFVHLSLVLYQVDEYFGEQPGFFLNRDMYWYRTLIMLTWRFLVVVRCEKFVNM